jgi:UDP-GlcNAc:undecaprenyl-phosphate GlcNAc-1-phosphate transferase
LQVYLLRFALALAASAILTFAVRAAARRFGFVAKPRADRWHRKPTALFGGVGIFLAFVGAVLFNNPAHVAGDRLLLVCAAAMFVLGFVDDLVQLKPYAKLVAQVVVCAIFTMFGMRLHWLSSIVADQALTVFWLVGITNALNLLDNLDGVAGGVAVIASAFLVYFCHVSGQTTAAALCAAFSGAAAGFVIFNFNPASIFMGDCGSLFLGFFLGGVTMVNFNYGARRNIVAVLSVPVLLLMLPIVDTTLVTVSRKLNGRRVSQGGRDHTAHRLVALGLSERAASLTLWTLAAASGGIAVAVRNLTWAMSALVIATFGLTVMFFLIFVGRVRVYEPISDETEGHGRALLPTLADFTYKRRIFEVLNDVVLIVIAYSGAFMLRFDGALVDPYYHRFLESLPVVLVSQLAAFLALGLYRGLWRYTSMSDLNTLGKAVLGGWVVSLLSILLFYRFEGFSRGMFVMDAVLLFCGVAGSRLSFRLLRAWLSRFQPPTQGRRVLIYGAGDAGELLVRELQNNRDLGLLPIGFVDDDPQKQGRVIHGVRVLGDSEQIKDLVDVQRIEEIVISSARINEDRSAAVLTLCQQAGVSCRRMRIALE